MADVQWVKQIIGAFDGGSFKRIKKAEIGGVKYRDKLTAIWFELIDLAGKCNADGQFIETPEMIVLGIDDIAILIDREPEEVKLCMDFYTNNRMVTVNNNIYSLVNWEKYQNTDRLAEIREQTRQRVIKHRENKRLQERNVTGSVTVTLRNAIEEEKEIEKEIHSITLCGENKHLEYMGGTLGQNVVLLSEEQKNDLLDKLSLDEFNKYVGIVAECELNGKKFKKKTHYQAILDMVAKDRKVAKI